jgi:hypothetical protein
MQRGRRQKEEGNRGRCCGVQRVLFAPAFSQLPKNWSSLTKLIHSETQHEENDNVASARGRSHSTA